MSRDTAERDFKAINAALGRAFSRYILERPGIAETIPLRAHLIFEIEGDEAFNAWSIAQGESGADPDQSIVHVRVEDFDPETERIIGQPTLSETAAPR